MSPSVNNEQSIITASPLVLSSNFRAARTVIREIRLDHLKGKDSFPFVINYQILYYDTLRAGWYHSTYSTSEYRDTYLRAFNCFLVQIVKQRELE